MICEYGCGQEAIHQFKNGKNCCSISINNCEGVIIRKGKKKQPKIIPREKPEFCDYGCGQEAKFYFKIVNKWCCSKHQNKCPEVRKVIGYPKGRKNPKLSKIMKGKKPWNEGVIGYHIHDEDFKKRAAEQCRNMIVSEKTREILRQNMLGDRNPSKRPDCREKIKQRMLNGGASHASSFNKNPSKPQVKLFNIIKEILSTAILNYPIKELNVNLDIAIPQLKIAFEYDGSYWHQDSKKDNERQTKIEKLGWEFIRYKEKDKFPTKDQIIKDMNKFLFLEEK